MRLNRRGFSIFELLIVLGLFSLLTMIALPRFANVREGLNLRQGTAKTTAMLATARASAIRWGRSVELRRDGNTLRVTMDTAGVTVDLVKPLALDNSYHVTLSSSLPDAITYNARGLATLAAGGYLVVHSGGRADSLCISRVGAILKGGCL